MNVRPDNAPILVVPDATGTLAFVTLRGGGLFVVDPTTTPMEILAEYDPDDGPRQWLRRRRSERPHVHQLRSGCC